MPLDMGCDFPDKISVDFDSSSGRNFLQGCPEKLIRFLS